MRRRPSAREEQTVLSGVLIAGLERTLRGEPITKSARRRLSAMGYIKRAGFDRFSKLTPIGLRALRDAKGNATYGNRTIENHNNASAIEARRAETGTGSVHESAAAKPDAQPSPEQSS